MGALLCDRPLVVILVIRLGLALSGIALALTLISGVAYGRGRHTDAHSCRRRLMRRMAARACGPSQLGSPFRVEPG